MDHFENVTVIKKANLYFDGKVSSRTVLFSDGTKKTLGIIMPGEYEFGTGDKEIMEILAGSLDVLLFGDTKWVSYEAGQSFTVPAKSSFKVVSKGVSDYCCSYINE
jgi:purine/pyrimidine-nucleoside phosphorylase